MEKTTTPKFVRWAVLISIVTLMTIFAFTAVSLLFPEPEFSEYCKQPTKLGVFTETECVAQDGVWESHEFIDPNTGEIGGYCDLQHECRAEYEAASTAHTHTVFLILLALGALSLLAGVFVKGSSIVAAGLSYGGLVIMIATGIRYLAELNQLLQLTATLVALIVVLVVAYKKFKD